MEKIYVAIVILVLLGLSLYLMEGDVKDDMGGNFTINKFFTLAENIFKTGGNLKSMNSIGINGKILNGKAVFIPLNEAKYGYYDKIKHQCMDKANITKNRETVGGLNKLCSICSSIRKEGGEENEGLTKNICQIVVDKKTQGVQLTEDDKDMYCNCCGYNDSMCYDSIFYVNGDDDEFNF
tara:strand:+ start:67 stop:606 length:540 start_codon:yes stop_codon:yes gene_type:complete